MSAATTKSLDEKIRENKMELGRDLPTEFKIFKTWAYNIFKTLDGNRSMNPHHLVRLKNSMSKRLLFRLVIVNEKYEIIDGQHSFETLRNMGEPIFYLIIPGYGLEEVHILNTNNSVWTKKDYMQGYCDMGKTAYIQLRQFLSDFPDLGIQSALRIMSGDKNAYKGGSNTRIKTFETGNLTINDLGAAYDVARKLVQIKPFYENYHRRSFVSAMCNLFNKKQYKHKELLGKLALKHRALGDAGTESEYLEMIEDAYNYKRKDKINLRY